MLETSAAAYAQNEIAWTPWLRTLAGLRLDGYRFDVDASDPANGGTTRAGIVSPKGGVVIGPFKGTELYANAGSASTATTRAARRSRAIRRPAKPVDPVTPLVRAKGAEGRHAHRRHSPSPEQPHGLDAVARVRAGVHGRRRHHRAEPPEPPLRHRVRELLRAAPLADPGRRHLVVARALHRIRSGRRLHSGLGREPSSPPASRSTACATCSAASGCATSDRVP